MHVVAEAALGWMDGSARSVHEMRAGGAEDAGIKVQPAGMRGFARKAVKMKTAPG